MNVRAHAAQILDQVLQRQCSLDVAFTQHELPAKDQAFLKALCYDAARFHTRLKFYLNTLLHKKIHRHESLVESLILIGLCQLDVLELPAHAAIHETVNACPPLKKTWAKGLVNAVLRNFLRQKSALHQAMEKNEAAFYAHPDWLLHQLKKDWPQHWQNIADANNAHPPMTLRVNELQTTREQYLKDLGTAQIDATAHPVVPSALTLKTPTSVSKLPGFDTGMASVQDAAPQLSAELLKLEPGLRVLDCCAAPGGKTCHILETESQLKDLVAIDHDAIRVRRITENLKRLQLEAKVTTADLFETKRWWDGKPFDRILLDAPCSATGVIRRHPDIKLLKDTQDLNKLSQQQLKMLHHMWPTLKPGGFLLYATCSVFPIENNIVIQKFLAENKNARLDEFDAQWGIPLTYGRQILPGTHDMDGFYYCRLKKV